MDTHLCVRRENEGHDGPTPPTLLKSAQMLLSAMLIIAMHFFSTHEPSFSMAPFQRHSR